MSGYRVVEFFKEVGKPVEAVPAFWLVGEEKVKWPRVGSTKLSGLIKKNCLPGELPNVVWDTLSCRILYSADDYREARKAAKQATYTSDIDLTDYEGLQQTETRVLRRQTAKEIREPVEASSSHIPSYEGSDGTVEVDVPGTHENIFTLEIPCSSAAQNLNEVARNVDQDDSILRELQREFRGFQDVVLEKLVKIGKELDHISRVLGRMTVSSVQHDGLELPNGLEIPIKDGREFSIFQQWLQDKTHQSNLVTFLRGIGGSNWKDCARRILDRIVSAELGKSINLSGANGKIAFRTHLLRNCIISSLRNTDSPESPTEKEVDEYFTRYFGGASDRNGGRAARQKPQQQDYTTVESH